MQPDGPRKRSRAHNNPARPADASALRTSPSAEDLRDLGAALDLLASRGSQRAVILIGTRAFLADVATRSIEREIDAQDSPHGPIAVDAAIRVRPSGEESPHVFLAPPNAIRPLFADFSQDGVYTARDSQSLASTGRRDRAAVS